VTVGAIGLHGGGELVRGDEPFLRAILRSALRAGRAREAECAIAAGGPPTVRIVVLPVAAGGDRPDLAVTHARAAFARVAADLGLAVEVGDVAVVDERTAADPAFAAAIAGGDLVYLPGGDPGRAARSLRDTVAGRALLAAHARGATVAGASAGAMALCDWTWTRDGGAAGLGLVAAIVVVPHADRFADEALAGVRQRAAGAPATSGTLALDERTGVVSGVSTGAGVLWRVAGPGRAAWLAPGAPAIVARDGDDLVLPG
jgi:cyanophycinase